MRAKTPIVLMCIILFLSSQCQGQGDQRKIEVLVLSKANVVQTLSAWFNAEPSIDFSIVVTRVYGEVTREDIRRYMRLYFPRSYQALNSYDFYYLAQTDMTFLSPKQEKWIYDAITGGSKGGVNTRSVMSTHDWFNVPWADSVVSEAFPNNADTVVSDEAHQQAPPGPLVIKDDPELPAIMKPYKEPLEGIFTNLEGLNTIPKPGSVILSYVRNNQGQGHPIPGQVAHIFYWKWNNSITFTFQDQPVHLFWNQPGSTLHNPYTIDITANVIWFATGRELPDDPLRVHDFRRDLYDFNIGKSLLVSLLDFAEKFGANPAPMYRDLDEVQGLRAQAKDHYLEGRFDHAYQSMKEANSALESLEEKAANLKDRALLWVYIVEWLSITGALLVAGFVVWTLMVRRTLYREVSATRTFD